MSELKRPSLEEARAKKRAKQEAFDATLTPIEETDPTAASAGAAGAGLSKDQHRSVALAVPSTCISDSVVKSYQQAVHTAYQIARAAVAYNVDEIIVFEPAERVDAKPANGDAQAPKAPAKRVFNAESANEQAPQLSERSVTLASLLQYFVTPPHLRKSVFPEASTATNFEYAKKLPKLLLPFMESRDAKYKEGMSTAMILNKNVKNKSSKQTRNVQKAEAKGLVLHPPTVDGTTPYINIGEAEPFQLEYGQHVPVGARVTIDTEAKKVVSPAEAYGRQTGYSVRVAQDFSHIFTMPSTPEGYDYTVWCPGGEFHHDKLVPENLPKNIMALPRTVKRPVFVFGQWDHVEAAVKHDVALGVAGARELFDSKLEFKRVVRVEDGVFVALDRLT